MDEIDSQIEREQYQLEAARAARRPAGPVATGRCLYCDEITGDEQRWCDAGCRNAWEREQ